jgi:hypothetical protein
MKDNYLHDKVRKIDDELILIKKKLESMNDNQYQIKNYKNKLYESVMKAIKTLENKSIKSLIIEEVNDHFDNKLCKEYINMKKTAKKNLKLLHELNDKHLKKFTEEIIKIRIEYSLVLAVLLNNNITNYDQIEEYKLSINKKEIESIRNEIKKKFNYNIHINKK